MLKIMLRLCALLFLCLLLVYLPEIYMSVSPSYHISVPERFLLRISLCAPDADSSDAFFRMLSSFMKENPSIHIRVIRTDEETQFSLPDPQPDLFVFPASPAPPSNRLLANDDEGSLTALFSASGCSPLLCIASRSASARSPTLDLLKYIAAFRP